MSEEGRLRRGKFYWEQRGRDDKLPDNIANHKGIMSEVNAYLDSIKVPEKTSKKAKGE